MTCIELNKKFIQGPLAVLMGGLSAERDISLSSGRAVMEVMQKTGVDVVAIDPAEHSLMRSLEDHQIAHTFIALHGVGGEDGTIQGFLETLGITYTGSGVLASALALDKLRCKQLWQGVGLPTPDFELLSDSTDWQALAEQFGCEAIVKPVREGSSIGMSKVASSEELRTAYEAARIYDDMVIAERWIEGEEFTVAILDDKPLPVIRLETDNQFYDYEAKYLTSDTRYHCPCGLSSDKEEKMKALALDAFNSLGCSGWGRVDIMQDGAGQWYLLEVNTVPGLTSHSLVPMAAQYMGLSFADLVISIFNQSLL